MQLNAEYCWSNKMFALRHILFSRSSANRHHVPMSDDDFWSCTWNSEYQLQFSRPLIILSGFWKMALYFYVMFHSYVCMNSLAWLHQLSQWIHVKLLKWHIESLNPLNIKSGQLLNWSWYPLTTISSNSIKNRHRTR